MRQKLPLPSLKVFWIALLTVGLTGCGGGGGGGGSNSNGNAAPVVPVVQPNVTVLPRDGSVTIAAQDANSVTLTGTVPALPPGQVIVSGAGDGLLRKVVSSTVANGTTVVQTQQAALEDVFQQADISLSKTLGPTDFNTITPMVAGVHIGAASDLSRGAAGPRDLTATLPFQFTHVKFPPSNPAAELNGTGSLVLSFDTLISIRFGQLQTVSWVPHLTGNLNFTVSSGTSQTFGDVKIPIAHLDGKQIYTEVAGIPVIFKPELDVYASMGGTVKAGVTISSNASVTVGAGVEYDQGSGWHPVTSYDQTFSLIPTLNSYESASYDITPLRAEFTLLIDDVAGPYVAIDLPKLDATFTAQTTPPSADVDIGGDFDGQAGFHVQIFKISVDYTTPPLDYHFDIYHKTYTNDGTVNVGVN